MELHKIFGNLEDSRTLIAKYADLDSRAWGLKFYVQHYNRKRLFNFLAVGSAGLLAYLLATPSSGKTDFTYMIIIAPFLYLLLRFVVGDGLDKIKRKSLIRKMQPEIESIAREMNQLVDRLDSFTVLPPKYRTIHAVDTIANYIMDNRIDSLKEGFNLYEDELFKIQQIQNQQMQIRQNHMMINQNSQMLAQNKKMIRAQHITNTLLMFGR